MLRFFDLSQDNIIVITRQLLGLLKVKVSDSTLSQTLQEHPDYPSLLSIADSLQTWKIETAGVKITYNQLRNLTCPVLVHFKTSQLYLVTEVTDSSVTYFNEKNRKAALPTKEFLDIWDGIALLASADSESGEQDYYKKHKKEVLQRIPVPTAILIVLLLLVWTGVASVHNAGIQGLFSFFLSIVILAGVIVSSLLLWYEIDKHNPLLQKICTGGKHTNCSAILQSGAAKLWGILPGVKLVLLILPEGFSAYC